MLGSATPHRLRIALIHATALAVEPIRAALQQHWPHVQCMNLLDDSLSVDLAQAGALTPAITQRFVDLAGYAKRAGCSGILFTCSAFGLAIEAAGAAVGLPTLKPNQAMLEDALALCPQPGAKLGLLATFANSLPPMARELQALAEVRGQNIHLQTAFVPEAMQDLALGHAGLHHQKIAAAAQALLKTMGDCQVVLLAQFSMAAALPMVQAALPGWRGQVLTSPDCAVRALRKTMGHD